MIVTFVMSVLVSLDLGFARDRLMLMNVNPGKTYSGATGVKLYWRILARIERLPGVSGATMASGTFVGNRESGPFSIDSDAGADASTVTASGMEVGSRFFATTGVLLVSGRDFTERDFTGTGPTPVIVSGSLARIFFTGVDPVGRHFKRGSRTSEIIGVARDMQFESLREATPFGVYMPFTGRLADEARPMIFHVRTALEPSTLAPSLRAIVHELEPAARITGLRTMDVFIDESLS
ncbi:MAG: ABC transporter permease [Verrucomicrobia bacterium]|nr:ABC transporter permease [Verrucomicrobiota bacterium]